MSITNSSHIVITGKNTFNHVQGNQVNGTINGNVIYNVGQAEVKRTRYDQFRQVIRGDVIVLKEIHSKEISESIRKYGYGKVAGKHKPRRTTCTVEVYPDRQSKFTAVMYEGEDAECVWEKEFEKFSCARSPLVAQLFGISRSEVPMLIFHDELIPLVHFFDRKSIWMHVYIDHLSENMKCSMYHLWMSTTSGVFLSGPHCPSMAPVLLPHAVKSISVPTTVDMLKDDTCIRFFVNFESTIDSTVLRSATICYRSTYLDDLFPATVEDHQSKDSNHPNWSSATHPYLRHVWQNPPDHFPMNAIGGFRFDTVYSPSMEAVTRWPRGAGSLWKWHKDRTGLTKETVLDGGLTRFELVGEEVYLETDYDWRKLWQGWLLQSSWVFDAIGVTEGKGDFFTVRPPYLWIESTRSPTASCNDEHPIKERPPTPIYLFLHPLPISVSELVSWMDGHFYFWSFDKTGQSRMLEEECERWGLPVLIVPASRSVKLHSWPNHIYTGLRDWQKARGFDPATSDWARHMDYPEWEIVGARKVQEEKKASRSWWQWEAVAGTEISAFGF